MSFLDEREERLNRYLPDNEIRDIVFGFENHYNEYLTDERVMIDYFHNMIMFGSCIVYKAFLNWKSNFMNLSSSDREEKISRFSNSKIRLYNLLNICYDIKKFDLDLIENLLINLQIDSKISAGEETFLKMIGLDGFFNLNDKLTNYIFELKKSKITSRGNINFDFEKLCDSFKMFDFLNHADVEFIPYECTDAKGMSRVVVKVDLPSNSRSIALDELLCCYNRHCYYLEDFSFIDPQRLIDDPEKRQRIKLIYWSYISNTSNQLYIEIQDSHFESNEGMSNNCFRIYGDTVIEDFLIEYDIINVEHSSESPFFFKDYISFNNKYIKYFALAIADTIHYSTKQRIIGDYTEKYRDVFEKLRVKSFAGSSNANYYRWDEIIILLLLEEGIFNFLFFLLGCEKYDDFIKAFRSRFSEVDTIINNNPKIMHPTLNLQFENRDAKKKCYANALIELASKLFSLRDEKGNSSIVAPSINEIIMDVDEKYSSSRINNAEKSYYLVIALLNAISFLDVFYYGLKDYIIRINTQELTYTVGSLPSFSKYNSDREIILNKFAEKVADRKLKHIYSFDVTALSTNYASYIESLKESFKLLFETGRNLQSRRDSVNEALYQSLGKREIFNADEMKKYSESLINSLSNLNEDISDKNLSNFHDSILDFLYYIGGFSGTKQIYNKAIFPIVCSYSNGVISRDGYRYSYMSVNNASDDHSTRIKMITNDELDFGVTYYCLPNIMRVANIKRVSGTQNNEKSESIWVNPLIISQNIFEKNASASFARLSDKDDYSAAAELLYLTDETIYGNLFGSLENAKIVLPSLFEDEQSVFFKNYVYIAKVDKKVVGIMTLYSKLPEWKPDVIKKAFEENHVVIPQTTERSYSYFKDTFNDTIGNNYMICDLCIKPEERRKGLARFLIYNAVKKVEERGGDLLITVYCDNSAAINLYISMGFIPYISEADTRGMKLNSNEYYKMIKFLSRNND